MEKLDIRGRFCPIPLFHTKRKLEGLSSGDILEVIVDDETAQDTIPRWCQIHNHEILSIEDAGEHFIITIKKCWLITVGDKIKVLWLTQKLMRWWYMVSEFAIRVREKVKDNINIDEGNCGTCHRVLREISEHGGYASTWEQPDGVRSKIYDDKGNVVGEGEGITWPPAILFAMVEGGFFTPEVEEELSKSLQCIIDMEKVADIYGYGRVVTPVALAYKEVWEAGGHVEIRRNRWGIEVVFYDPDGGEIAVGPISH